MALIAVVYLLLARSILFIGFLYCLIYFVASSDPVRKSVSQAVSEAIPGYLTAGAIQWGPHPGDIRMGDVRVYDPEGREVARIDALKVNFRLLTMLGTMTRNGLMGTGPLTIETARVDILRPRLGLRESATGELNLTRAFVETAEQGTTTGSQPIEINLPSIHLADAQATLDTPTQFTQVKGLNSHMAFQRSADGSFNYQTTEGRIDEIICAIKPSTAGKGLLARKTIPIRKLVWQAIIGTSEQLTLNSLTASVADGSLQANGVVSFGGQHGVGVDAQAQISLPSHSNLISQLTDDMVDGGFQLRLTSTTTDEGLKLTTSLSSDFIRVTTIESQNVELTARFEKGLLHLDRLTGRVFGGNVNLTDGELSLQPNSEGHLAAHFAGTVGISSVDPGVIVDNFTPFPVSPLVPFLNGSIGGKVTLSGRIEPHHGFFVLDGNIEGLTMDWAGHPRIPIQPTYKLLGGFQIKVGSEAYALLEGRVRPVMEVNLNHVAFISGPNIMNFNGVINVGDDVFGLVAKGNIPTVAPLLSVIGLKGMGGALALNRLDITGPLSSPDARADIRLSRAKLFNRPAGTITGSIILKKGLVEIPKLKAVLPKTQSGGKPGTLEVAAQLRIWNHSASNIDPLMPFRVRKLNALRIPLHRIAPELGLQSLVNFTLDQDLRGNARQPLRNLRGSGNLSASGISKGKLRLRELGAQVKANADGLQIKKAKVTLCRIRRNRCEAGGPSLQGGLNLFTRRGTFNSTVTLRDFPLRTIRQFTPGFPLLGRVSAKLNISGKPSAPRMIGTAQIDGLEVNAAQFGDVALEFTWGEHPGEVIIHSSKFLQGATLKESELVFRRGAFRRLTLRAETKNFNVFDILPAMRNRIASLRHTGDMTFEFLSKKKVSWYAKAFAKPGNLTLLLHDEKGVYRNATATTIRMGADGLTLKPLTLVSPKKRKLTLCGTMNWDLALNLEFTGELGMELFKPVRAIRDSLSQLSGAVRIGKPMVTGNRINQCLPLRARRVFRVAGPISSPSLTGRLRAKGLTFMPRGMGRLFTIADNAAIEFRPLNNQGRQGILFPSTVECRQGTGVGKGCFKGSLEDGSFRLLGRVELNNLALVKANLKLVGNDIYYSSSGEYNLTFNPDISLTVSNFSDETQRKLLLAGNIEITDGTYYKSFDGIAKVVGSVSGGQLEEFGQPITERLPWLKQLRLNLHLKSPSHNVNVSSAFPLGTANLDARFNLRLAGDLENLQVRDRVELAPGGTVTYQIISREFEVLNAYLDFQGDPGTPVIDVKVQTEVVYLESNSSSSSSGNLEEKTVLITVILKGVLPDELQVSFESNPGGFDEADLQNLLLTGKPLSTGATAKEDLQFNLPIGKVLKNLLASPFVETVNVGLDSTGDWASEILTRLGRYASLQARAATEEGDTTRLTARFQFRISDDVTLEGHVDRKTSSTSSAEETYQAKIKYRIPLD